MRRSMRVILVGVGLSLAACAHEAPTVWDKPGAASGEWQTALYECERDARQSARSFGTGVVAEMRANQFMDRCLNTKGWRQVAQ